MTDTPFNDLLGNDTTRHSLEVFLNTPNAPTDTTILPVMTGDTPEDISTSINHLLDLNIITETDISGFYQLNTTQPVTHLLNGYEQLHDHTTKIHSHVAPEDTVNFHTGSPFNCLLKHDDTRLILSLFLTNDTIPFTPNQLETTTNLSTTTVKPIVTFLQSINLIEHSSQPGAYRLAQTEFAQHFKRFDSYLHRNATTITNPTPQAQAPSDD